MPDQHSSSRFHLTKMQKRNANDASPPNLGCTVSAIRASPQGLSDSPSTLESPFSNTGPGPPPLHRTRPDKPPGLSIPRPRIDKPQTAECLAVANWPAGPLAVLRARPPRNSGPRHGRRERREPADDDAPDDADTAAADDDELRAEGFSTARFLVRRSTPSGTASSPGPSRSTTEANTHPSAEDSPISASLQEHSALFPPLSKHTHALNTPTPSAQRSPDRLPPNRRAAGTSSLLLPHYPTR